MSKESLLKEARRVIMEGDEEGAREVAKKTIEEGMNPLDVINQALTPAMAEVGDAFGNEQIPLPSVLISAEAMTAALEVLEPHIPKQKEAEKKATIVMGTVEGDIHDIGKRIVCTMLRVYGFDVTDLGRDVPIGQFVEKARELDADIIGTSSLMTTTMAGQRTLESELTKAGLRDRVKTMVGGAAATQQWADKIGADSYAENANEAVLKVKELIS